MSKRLILVFCLASLLLTIISKPFPGGVYYVQSARYFSYWEAVFDTDNIVTISASPEDPYQRITFTLLSNGYYTITTNDGYNLVAVNSPIPEETIIGTSLDNPDDHSQQFKIIRKPSGLVMFSPRIDLSKAIEPSVNDGGDLFLNDKNCKGKIQLFEFVWIGEIEDRST